MSLRLDVIAAHEKSAQECRDILATLSDTDPRRRIVEKNLKANESCISFLTSITDEQGEVSYE